MLVSVLTLGAVVTLVGGPWMAAVAAALLGVVAAWGFRRLRGATLAAPALWAAVSAFTLALVEAAAIQSAGSSESLSTSLWRYAAAVGAFCPLMAVLGAKRPQDRGWQWVVLSLWVILLVPAMQAFASRSGQQLELFGAWRLLLWALLAMGLLNYLPTRFGLPAVIATVGQLLLLAPYLFADSGLQLWRPFGSVMLLLASCVAMALAGRQHVRTALADDLQDFDDRWFHFRDGWGAFWGLRILQRVNQTAELSGWPVRLEWSGGFVAASSQIGNAGSAIDSQIAAHIEQTLDSLLRRFERLDAERA